MKKLLVMFFGLIILTSGFVVAQMESYEIPSNFGYDCSIYGGMMIEEGMHGYDFCMQKGFRDFCLIDRMGITEQYTTLDTGAQGAKVYGCGGAKYLLYRDSNSGFLSCVNTLHSWTDECKGTSLEGWGDQIICCKKNTDGVTPPSTNCESSCDSNSCKICEGDVVLFTDSSNDEWDISIYAIGSSSVVLDIEGERTRKLAPNDEWPFYDHVLVVKKVVYTADDENNDYAEILIADTEQQGFIAGPTVSVDSESFEKPTLRERIRNFFSNRKG